MNKESSGLYTAQGRVEQETTESENEFQAHDISLTDEELVALCKDRVCPACDQKEQADDQRLRNLAEMDNYKKRLAREQEEFRKYATESVLADMLPVMDNLDLALQHGQHLETCKDLVMGVDMTRKLFLEAVRQHGLTQLGAEGEQFDPEWHEAVGQESREDLEPGIIITVYQKGYVLRERLLRPAKVVVNKVS